jgi:hypothetical protein
MKYLAFVLTAVLTGCASPAMQVISGANTAVNMAGKIKGGISYDEMAAIKVSDRDCPQIDQKIDYINKQLKARGTYGKNPEDLDESDRAYNEKGHILIWALRIGCNNPHRYDKT